MNATRDKGTHIHLIGQPHGTSYVLEIQIVMCN